MADNAPSQEPFDTPKLPSDHIPDFRQQHLSFAFSEPPVVQRPLSNQVEALLAKHSKGPLDSKLKTYPKRLAAALEKLLLESERVALLRSHSCQGAVYKCSEDIVIKIALLGDFHTEYSTLEYLEANAPTIPAPRPHGLIVFGDKCQAQFMTHIPGATLSTAFPKLSPEQKLSLQRQLDNILSQMRALPLPDHKELGGVSGDGVKNAWNGQVSKGIKTVAEYNKWRFSAKDDGHGEFYHSLLELDGAATLGPVFTHGDFRFGNIMVRRDPNADGGLTVSGLVDWEHSGFYPAYVESLQWTHGIFPKKWDVDRYWPECISPKHFPLCWSILSLRQLRELWGQEFDSILPDRTCSKCGVDLEPKYWDCEKDHCNCGLQEKLKPSKRQRVE